MNKSIKNNFKKSITSILILSTFLLPFFGASEVYAQLGSYNGGGGYTSGGSYNSGSKQTGGITAYISGLAPAIAELPLCKDKIIGKWTKGLFKDIPSAVLKATGGNVTTETKLLEPDEFNISQAIPIYDANLLRTTKQIQASQKEAETSLSALEEADSCTKSIGRLVVKMLLQKITLSTVEWINNGAQGKPFFLENPKTFFGDIAETEILQFKSNIDNPKLYPFGRDFLRAQVNLFNRGFAQSARYSANDLIQKTTPEYDSTTFSTNFSYGGWNAWDAWTQVPANNSLGFNIIASTELSKRLEGTSTSTAIQKRQELAQSDGILGDERCVEPKGLTRAQDKAALVQNVREITPGSGIIDNNRDGVADLSNTIGNIDPRDRDGDGILNEFDTTPDRIINGKETGYIVGTCRKWEYVTPGKAISEAVTKLVNYPDNNLLKADDLNAAIAAIMDAAMNRFIPNLANEGLAYLDTSGSDGAFIIDGDNRTTGGVQQVALDFPANAINSNWLRENSDFNIRTDLTQAVIDEQRIYQRKILEENAVLEDLITTVYQLDYCIPGPHPGFEDDSERTLNAVKNTIISKSASDFKNVKLDKIVGLVKTAGYAAGAVIGASIGSAVLPVVGTAVGLAIGAVFGAIVDWIGAPKDEEKVDIYYGGIMRALTGVHVSKPHTKLGNIRSKHDITSAMDTMLDRYIKLIHKYYTPNFLPAIAPTARIEFNKIPGYREKIRKNEYASATLEGVITRLAKLKDQLDKLNPEINPEANPEYQDYLPLINEFSRLSASMVTGNDIQVVYDETKEYSSQIKYVYDDLLTGPYGCEKELEKNEKEPTSGEIDTPFVLRQTWRTEYPFKIWYDYNELGQETVGGIVKSGVGKGADIPVPEELKKYNILPPAERVNRQGVKQGPNKMPPYEIGPFGPGFLSNVVFAYNLKTPADPKQSCEDFLGYGGTPKVITEIEVDDEGAETTSTFTELEGGRYSNILDCIYVGDLFYNVNSWPVSVGRKQGTAINGEPEAKNFQKDVSFEQTIGIY